MDEENRFRRMHSETHFYKYAKASTARHVLEYGRFLAQSPLKFNDPFDVQTGFHYEFDVESFPDILHEKMVELIESDKEPDIVQPNPISDFILKLRKATQLGKLSSANLKRETKSLFEVLRDRLKEDRQNFIDKRMTLIKRMRMLCLSTSFDNMLMWSHYAEDHSGVVIKLKVADSESDDDPLWLPEKVTYTQKAAPLIGRKEILDLTFGLKKLTPKESGRHLALVKFDAWKYEDEYRFWDVVSETNKEPYTIEIHSSRFEAIYFGIKVNPEDFQEISILARKLNPNIEIYQAQKHESEFRIRFEKVSHKQQNSDSKE